MIEHHYTILTHTPSFPKISIDIEFIWLSANGMPDAELLPDPETENPSLAIWDTVN